MLASAGDLFNRTSMTVFQFGSAAPDLIRGAVTKCKIGLVAAKGLAMQGYEHTKTKLWPEYGVPLYERNIAPLGKLEYTVAASCLIVGTIITGLALAIFGIEGIVAAVWLDILLILSAGYCARHGVRKHFDAIAETKINELREIALTATCHTPHLKEMQEKLNEFDLPEFSHRQEVWKELKERQQNFRNLITERKIFELRQDFLKSCIEIFLKGFNSIDRTFFDDLIKEISVEKSEFDHDKLNNLLNQISSQCSYLDTNPALSIKVHLQELIEAKTLKEHQEEFSAYLDGVIQKLDRIPTQRQTETKDVDQQEDSDLDEPNPNEPNLDEPKIQVIEDDDLV